MPIDIQQHVRFILRHGDRVVHYKGVLCSCSPTGRPEEADLTCRKCSGLGVFWIDPITIVALIHGLDSDRSGRMWLQTGIALPEDMSCSPLPNAPRRFKDYDKVIPTWQRGFPYPGELLIRGQKDTLIYRPVGKILRVSQVNPASGKETLWEEGEDFELLGDDKKKFGWKENKGPAASTTYAVQYEPRFEFVAWNPPAPRWERGRDLGLRVLLRKIHLPWPVTNWG